MFTVMIGGRYLFQTVSPGADPGGVVVRVHKQTGETEMEMSL